MILQELAHAIGLPERRELLYPVRREQQRAATPQPTILLPVGVEIERPPPGLGRGVGSGFGSRSGSRAVSSESEVSLSHQRFCASSDQEPARVLIEIVGNHSHHHASEGARRCG